MKLQGLLKACLSMLFFIYSQQGIAQQLKLGTNPNQVDKNAVLDLNADKQGLLLPRVLKLEILTGGSLVNAADGMFVYITDEASLYLKKAGAWKKVADFANLTHDVTGGVSYDTLHDNHIVSADAPDVKNWMKVWSSPVTGAADQGPAGTVANDWNVLSFQNGAATTQLYFDRNTFAVRKWKGTAQPLTEDDDHDPWYKAVMTSGTGNFTDGGLIFAGKTSDASSEVTQDAANLFWNKTSKRLGLNTNNPTATLDVNGTTKVGENGSVLTGIIRAIGVHADGSADIPTAESVLTFTVPNVVGTLYGNVIINPRSIDPSGNLYIISSRVSGDNQVTVLIKNGTGGAIPVASLLFDLTVIQ